MIVRRFAVNAMLFVLVAGGLGFGLTDELTGEGSRLSVRWSGPWAHWTSLGKPDADPYARAFMLRRGMLPVAASSEAMFMADTDSAGGWLNAACEYRIVVPGFSGAWWTIAAYSNKGALVANAAERYAFNADTAMQESDGRATITLARDARPGNWLPIGGGTQIKVVLTVQISPEQGKVAERAMPEIERLRCR